MSGGGKAGGSGEEKPLTNEEMFRKLIAEMEELREENKSVKKELKITQDSYRDLRLEQLTSSNSAATANVTERSKSTRRRISFAESPLGLGTGPEGHGSDEDLDLDSDAETQKSQKSAALTELRSPAMVRILSEATKEDSTTPFGEKSFLANTPDVDMLKLTSAMSAVNVNGPRLKSFEKPDVLLFLDNYESYRRNYGPKRIVQLLVEKQLKYLRDELDLSSVRDLESLTDVQAIQALFYCIRSHSRAETKARLAAVRMRDEPTISKSLMADYIERFENEKRTCGSEFPLEGKKLAAVFTAGIRPSRLQETIKLETPEKINDIRPIYKMAKEKADEIEKAGKFYFGFGKPLGGGPQGGGPQGGGGGNRGGNPQDGGKPQGGGGRPQGGNGRGGVGGPQGGGGGRGGGAGGRGGGAGGRGGGAGGAQRGAGALSTMQGAGVVGFPGTPGTLRQSVCKRCGGDHWNQPCPAAVQDAYANGGNPQLPPYGSTQPMSATPIAPRPNLPKPNPRPGPPGAPKPTRNRRV